MRRASYFWTSRRGTLTRRQPITCFDALAALVRASGVATLFATHNLELADRMDRAITLQDGHVKDL